MGFRAQGLWFGAWFTQPAQMAAAELCDSGQMRRGSTYRTGARVEFQSSIRLAGPSAAPDDDDLFGIRSRLKDGRSETRTVQRNIRTTEKIVPEV